MKINTITLAILCFSLASAAKAQSDSELKQMIISQQREIVALQRTNENILKQINEVVATEQKANAAIEQKIDVVKGAFRSQLTTTLKKTKCEWTPWVKKWGTFEAKPEGEMALCPDNAYMKAMRFNHKHGVAVTHEEHISGLCCYVDQENQ